MPLVQTRGAASAQGFGEFAQAGAVNYIEDVFSCFLYTGNSSTQTITNGINLSGKGGLVWSKARSSALSNFLCDTDRGRAYYLYSNATVAQQGPSASDRDITSFNSNGYSLGPNANADINTNAVTFASWTFRKQPKFFDVVTWTGTGGVRTLTHNLGSTPGSIFVKKIVGAPQSWAVYHRSLGATKGLALDLTNAADVYSGYWNNTEPTATQFTVGSALNMAQVDDPGAAYVAYLFAHDAGGFGLSGTDNVISCGSFTTDASGNFSVNLGYEPQWVMIKSTNNTGVSATQQNWIIFDNMRGFVTQPTSGSVRLFPNLSNAEASSNDLGVTSTGFNSLGNMSASAPFIYIAIRRGPMKVPTLGTSVFAPVSRAGTYTVTSITAGFAPDLIVAQTSNLTYGAAWWDRLRGKFIQIRSYTSAAEMSSTDSVLSFDNNGVTVGLDGNEWINGVSSGNIYANWIFRRAPSFFDEVCFTSDSGGGTGANLPHNLTVQPNLMIFKARGSSSSWLVTCTEFASWQYFRIYLDSTAAKQLDGNGVANSNASTFAVFNNGQLTANSTYVAYLFASCAGVSKVGSYTGNAGYTVVVPCGFTAGVRFVLIKRTDSTGDWWTYDSARGITSGNDPYLYLNTTAAEVGGTDYIDSYSAGFEVTSTAPAGLNATGGTYIFLAIA